MASSSIIGKISVCCFKNKNNIYYAEECIFRFLKSYPSVPLTRDNFFGLINVSIIFFKKKKSVQNHAAIY